MDKFGRDVPGAKKIYIQNLLEDIVIACRAFMLSNDSRAIDEAAEIRTSARNLPESLGNRTATGYVDIRIDPQFAFIIGLRRKRIRFVDGVDGC